MHKLSTQSKKPVGFLCLGLSIFLAYRSYEIFVGEVSLPYDCSGKGRLICGFINIVFIQSGYFVVGMLTLASTVFTFLIAYVFLTDGSDVSKSSRKLYVNSTKGMDKRVENKQQTLNDVLVDGQEPTAEFLEELNAVHNAPPLSDDELEKQALSK
jgi:hypothetical protein